MTEPKPACSSFGCVPTPQRPERCLYCDGPAQPDSRLVLLAAHRLMRGDTTAATRIANVHHALLTLGGPA